MSKPKVGEMYNAIQLLYNGFVQGGLPMSMDICPSRCITIQIAIAFPIKQPATLTSCDAQGPQHFTLHDLVKGVPRMLAISCNPFGALGRICHEYLRFR
jgi:hypothetical protein